MDTWTPEPCVVHVPRCLCTKVEPQGLSSPAGAFLKCMTCSWLYCGVTCISQKEGQVPATPYQQGTKGWRPPKTWDSKGLSTKRPAELAIRGVWGGRWWDDNLECSLENSSVMAEPFICVALQEGSQFPIFQELPTCCVEWFSIINSLMVLLTSMVGWEAWSPYKWKQLASDTQDRFLVANLESFVCSSISKIVFPEKKGVNVYLDKEHHIHIQIFLSYRLSQHP